ncbi:MAG: hypothetical protein Q9227_005777 [Pyrenula ochraceoflavens]
MGWWWSSAPPENSERSQTSKPTEQSAPPPRTSSLPNATSQPTPPSRPLTRDEQADLEFQTLLSELQSSTHSERPIRTPLQAIMPDPPRRRPPPNADPNNPYPPTSASSSSEEEDISFSSLTPTTMSCRDTLDYAIFCQGMGGQFVNGYRYGTWRDCSEHWSDFFFCMRSKSYSDEKRAEMIRERYREKERRKYGVGASSEDVWEVRERPMKGQMTGDWEGLERRWREAEEERRRVWEDGGKTWKKP